MMESIYYPFRQRATTLPVPSWISKSHLDMPPLIFSFASLFFFPLSLLHPFFLFYWYGDDDDDDEDLNVDLGGRLRDQIASSGVCERKGGSEWE